MSLKDAAAYLATWSLLGAVLFSVFVVFIFRSDLVYASRRKDGMLKERIPVRGYLVMGAFLCAIVGFLVLANYVGLVRRSVGLGFGGLFLLNLLHYLILFLYDTAFVDGFVLSHWRPAFLRLPEEMGRESMREHITRSIPVGSVAGVLMAALASAISYLILVR
jgi:ABC-type Fe3+ transport system permease subunit